MTITSRAVITGGAGAVGAALAGRLLTAGWEVRSLDLLDPAQAAERHPNLAVHWHQVDVTRPETLHALGDLGSVDALVNSAGYWPRIALEDTTPQQWRAIIEVNLTGTFLVTRHFIPALRAARGCVVNVSSAVALKGEPMLGAYGAAKAGVLGLTKTLARELGRDGVRVNAVAPGLLDTDGNHEIYADEAFAHAAVGSALGRRQSAADPASAVMLLIGADSAFVTGQTLVADGGVALH